jgi:hypothetical protein
VRVVAFPLAALLWIAGSCLLSWYLSNFGNYDATYGSRGAAIGLMMWMWMSAINVLCGAELNFRNRTPDRAGYDHWASKAARRAWRCHGRHVGSHGSGRLERTLAFRININAKVAALGEAQQLVRTASAFLASPDDQGT